MKSNMSSPKSDALTLLMVGSILLFILSCWHIFEIFLPYGHYYYISFPVFISIGLEFISALLLMIGFIQYRGEQSKRAPQMDYGVVSSTVSQIQGAPARFCPKCGKQISTDAQFCPFCGWQLEGQKRK